MGVEVKNRIQALLDKYELDCYSKHEFTDLFGKSGMQWLESLELDNPVDQAILDSDLKLLRSLDEQIELITGKIASIATQSEDVKLLMTLPGIDFYSAMLLISEIGDIKRFQNAKKICSWAGMVPSIHQSGNTAYMGRITKRGSKWVRWILIQAAQTARLHDERLGRFYERVANRRGHHKAVVATAREMLTIIFHMLSKKESYRGTKEKLQNQKYKRMERLASKQVRM